MSKRIDIIDGKEAARVPYGLVYTEVLGWIDLGHAQGTDIRNLLRDINVSYPARITTILPIHSP